MHAQELGGMIDCLGHLGVGVHECVLACDGGEFGGGGGLFIIYLERRIGALGSGGSGYRKDYNWGNTVMRKLLLYAANPRVLRSLGIERADIPPLYICSCKAQFSLRS
jgi:hypothetical protein